MLLFLRRIILTTILVFSLFPCLRTTLTAQVNSTDTGPSIIGAVHDDNGNALPGVNVVVKGTSTGTTTNSQGAYSLDLPGDAETLIFSYIGYLTKEISLGNQTEINVTLETDERALEEVVVVGYGQQKKISVTGAVSSVDIKDLRKTSTGSLATSLAGRIPGLSSVQMGGGQPGRDDPVMYLRGAATTNGKGPLILIDGVPRDNIRAIDPNEVASISVLKDASATAVFGVRGANGVIMITTRRGTQDKPELLVNFQQSFTSFTREPEKLDNLEYMRLRNEASANDGIEPAPFSQEMMDKFADPLAGLDPSDPNYERQATLRKYIYPNHDYYRQLIKRYTPETRINVNASGGTGKVSYFSNASYLHQGGNLNTDSKSKLGYDPSIWMDRFNFRTNLDFQISQSLKAYMNVGSYIEKVNMPSAGIYPGSDTQWMIRDFIYQAQTVTPITPGPYTIDGYGVPAGMLVAPNYLDRSPYEIINRYGFRSEVRSQLNSSIGAEWDLSELVTKGLSIKGMVSYDSRSTTAMQGTKTEKLYVAQVDYETDSLTYAVQRSDENLLAIGRGADSRYNINMQASLNYQRQFGTRHNITGLILAQRDYWETQVGEIPHNVLGVSGRATYDYDSRYLAEFNMGYNGSEQFAPRRRYGFFPAFSAGWVVSNENFLKGNNLLTNLKLRFSYGKVGNDLLGGARFLYQSDITLLPGGLGSLGQGNTIAQGLLGNPNISWEVAAKKNFGIDLQLFSNLDLTFDYFIENRSDILITRGTVPEFQGVPLGNVPKANLGRVDNRGFEIELNYTKAFTKDLSLRVNGNYSLNKNNVVFADEPIRDETYFYRYRSTGFPLNQAWGYKIDYSNGNGFFNSEEELTSYLAKTTYGFGEPRVGDFKYLDLNGDGTIDDKDLSPIGYSGIPGINYGLNVAIQYWLVDFTIFFQGVGRFTSNYAAQGVYESIKNGTYFGYHRTAWTPERFAAGEEITYPALSTRSTTNHTSNDFFVMDRSFLRLRNVEIGLNLPPNALKFMGVKSGRIFLSGQNLFIWDKLRLNHLDPENSDAIGYPTTKMIFFGANITF